MLVNINFAIQHGTYLTISTSDFISQAQLENHYRYKVMQSHFNSGDKESIDVSCKVVIRCEAGKMTKNAFIKILYIS